MFQQTKPLRIENSRCFPRFLNDFQRCGHREILIRMKGSVKTKIIFGSESTLSAPRTGSNR
jgi:hypothetical protein